MRRCFMLRGLVASALVVSARCPGQCESEWSGLNGGVDKQFSGVDSFASFDEGHGQGPVLFCGSGGYGTFAGVECETLARWDGWRATAVQPQPDNSIKALLSVPVAAGAVPAGLYAAGVLNSAGDLPLHNLARWDGDAWHDVGGGLTAPEEAEYGYALCIFDEDGQGPKPPRLYAGGQFTYAGGVPAVSIASWDGQAWSALGEGLKESHPDVRPSVYALAVHDDGRGPALYVGGSFYYAGGQKAYNIARWDGKVWEPVGGPGSGLDATVEALCVYDEDGNGPKEPALFAAGQFSHVVFGTSADGLARWDGQEWSDVGGLSVPGVIFSLAVHRSGDDERENLYIGGNCSILPDGTEILGIARWNGQVWRECDFGIWGGGGGTGVDAMGVFDEDGDGPNPGGVYVGGIFSDVGTKGVKSRGVARWGCPLPPPCDADLDRSGDLDLFDFLAFTNLFNAKDPLADFDGNGAFDLFDFLAFVNAFNAGC